ncbi:hypothetical protein CO038_03870 [Candidatus Pacearchaeota archaeon CG_4_9_14_0_2_um_filter_39_13]|nr:MAG: hypothetical protein AUJ64_00865 [Candidatus Pacearchaeota archaeon CG1_02_39_14]PJC44414.1 MAG: hypothetical protein CO038_03870 [Candidatus Pacearchaeota archaeon CG_4_9_14_0_2_um_filter_39_13]
MGWIKNTIIILIIIWDIIFIALNLWTDKDILTAMIVLNIIFGIWIINKLVKQNLKTKNPVKLKLERNQEN